MGRGPAVALYPGATPKHIAASQALFGPTNTIPLNDLNIGATPTYNRNLVLLVSNQAPDVPAGWILTINGAGLTPVTGYRVYALERPADSDVTVDLTFSAGTARGIVSSFFIEDTTVIARGSTDLPGGVTSLNVDIDRTDPALPTTTLFGLLTTGTGPRDSFPSWQNIVAAGLASGGETKALDVNQHEAEPPATDWIPTGTTTFHAWFYWEMGSP